MTVFKTFMITSDLMFPNSVEGAIDQKVHKFMEERRNCKEISRKVTTVVVPRKGKFKGADVVIVVNSTFECQ